MHVGVIEPDGGLRTCLELFLKDEGHTTQGYWEIPATYDGIEVVIFGPGLAVPEKQKEHLDERHIPYFQLPYFVLDIDDVMKQIASFARMEQSILEDRAV